MKDMHTLYDLIIAWLYVQENGALCIYLLLYGIRELTCMVLVKGLA